MLIMKYVHTSCNIYVYRWIYIYLQKPSLISKLNKVRLETSAVYRINPQLHTHTETHTPRFHIAEPVIVSLYVHPTREFSPLGVFCRVWSRPHGLEGEPGSSSDCTDGSVRLRCASVFVQAEHRALSAAVCPFLTLAPFFYVNRLFMARDRQTWLTSESIFQVIIWLA